METDPPKNNIVEEEENESEDQKEINQIQETKSIEDDNSDKSDNESNNKIVSNNKNESDNDEDSINDSMELEPYTEKCDVLKMTTVPTFGKYSDDYSFLEQILILKSDSKSENIPDSIKSKLDNLKKKYPKVEPEFFHITLGTNLIKPNNENEVNDSYETLNLLCHPYIFYNCSLNQEHRTNIFCAAFIDEDEIGTVKEAQGNDILRINPQCELFDDQLKRELILHTSNDGYASLSPNNCAILINLNSQITNFYVVVCGTYNGEIVKCFVGNYVIIPNAQNSVLFGDLYEKMMKEKKKKNLVEELIILKNKFRDFLNYIFNYGINEIVNHGTNMEDTKLCIMKVFSYIFDFDSADNDNNTKKIHEKELLNMQKYYYDNFINFVTSLYEFGNLIDPNFGEKLVLNSIKNKFIEELLVKYRDYNIRRFNNIILNYEFFIYENDNILMDLQDKANQKYAQSILPNLKEFFSDKLNLQEENLDEIKDNFSEENRNHKDNPNIQILINICNSIRNKEDINNHLNQLDEIIKKYLFYLVWVYKNRPNNIHYDFGRVSFMNIEIDCKYYCNQDDKINCCQQLIQILEKADDKNYN